MQKQATQETRTRITIFAGARGNRTDSVALVEAAVITHSFSNGVPSTEEQWENDRAHSRAAGVASH